MAKTKRSKAAMAEPISGTTKTSSQCKNGPDSNKEQVTAGRPVSGKPLATAGFLAKTTALPTTVPISVKETTMPTDTAKVRPLDFHGFISELKASPFATKTDATAVASRASLPAESVVVNAAKHLSRGCLVPTFPRLKALRALSQSWGASFQLHDSGWLIFRFARAEDKQRILARGPYFVYGRPLLLKNMSDCFEFKEDDISLTLVWATLPSLPLECWHPNALGKIGSRLSTPITMDSLTIKMEYVSYARILVEVDASKKLVDHVEFILPNGVARKQPIVYEFTPEFCSTCNRFGHLKESCQPSAAPSATATNTAARNANDAVVKTAAPKKAPPIEWTVVQHRQRNNLKQQQPAEVVQQPDATPVTSSGKQSQTAEQQLIPTAVPMIRRPAVVETDSEASSFGSSNDQDSPTLTQHLMPGAKASILAPNDPKMKQQLGGESPPPSL
ncbi:UNVERIFIED_CONTAM: hypothetical protein Sradi_5111200 [Sesamum radiatum]|uniref:DUF4283 domain-containing protein n=1 Tax=Sesamum radiatum TaxID=300843 RepID=A0AAW2M3L4_SESRA